MPRRTRTAGSRLRRRAIGVLLVIVAVVVMASPVTAGDGWVSSRVANLLISGRIDIEVRGGVARGIVAGQTDEGLWLLRPGSRAKSVTKLTKARDWDPDLEIDGHGAMHIAFTRTLFPGDSNVWRVMYGTNASGAWTFWPVYGTKVSRGLSPDLELTENEGPVIAYTRRPGHALYLARPAESGWSHEHVPTSAAGIRMVLDLELAPSGRPRVLHHTYQGPLVLATRGPAVWTDRVIVDAPYLQEATLAIASDGRPHIAYQDEDVRYARLTTAGWTDSLVSDSLGLHDMGLRPDDGALFILMRYDEPDGLRACSLGPLRMLICAAIPSSPDATWTDVAIGVSGRAWVGYGRYVGIDACGYGPGTCQPWVSRER